jgi:cobalt-zinc-cadmium efflux system outer membrane protein
MEDRKMYTIRYAFLILGIMVISAGCTTIKEGQGLSEWKDEVRIFSGNINDVVDLPDLVEDSTVDDYVLYALLNNPGLRASFERWKAALEKVDPASSLPDPRFTYSNYIREVETRVGAQKQTLGLTQTFPWFGKLDLKGEIALQAANAERQRYEASKLDLIYLIKITYYEYCYIAQAINITKENLNLVTHFESVARAKYKGGTGLQSAVIKTQVELGKLEDNLLSLQDLIQPITAKLNMALNRPAHMPLPAPKSIPEEKYDLIHEELLAILRTENPSLKTLDFMVAKEDLAVKLTEKDFFPDITLGVNFIDTNSRLDMDPPDNGKDPVIANLSINLPIWHNKYDAESREAQARYRAALSERTEKENSLIADFEMAIFKLRDAGRKIDLYRDTLLPMAEQNVQIDQQAFTSDIASFLDLIDSQRVLLGFQLEYKRALTDYAQRLAEIEKLTGGNFERNIR